MKVSSLGHTGISYIVQTSISLIVPINQILKEWGSLRIVRLILGELWFANSNRFEDNLSLTNFANKSSFPHLQSAGTVNDSVVQPGNSKGWPISFGSQPSVESFAGDPCSYRYQETVKRAHQIRIRSLTRAIRLRRHDRNPRTIGTDLLVQVLSDRNSLLQVAAETNATSTLQSSRQAVRILCL